MTGDQERAFDEQSLTTAENLWGGQVRFDAETYSVSLTRNQTWIRFSDGDGAGTREVDGLQIELAKSKHPAAPAVGTIVEDLGTGRLFRVMRVGGRGDTDAAWYLECAIDERG